MNATNESNSKELDNKPNDTFKKLDISAALGAAGSIRPQKSMMRIKSLRPQKLKVKRTIRPRKITVN